MSFYVELKISELLELKKEILEALASCIKSKKIGSTLKSLKKSKRGALKGLITKIKAMDDEAKKLRSFMPVEIKEKISKKYEEELEKIRKKIDELTKKHLIS